MRLKRSRTAVPLPGDTPAARPLRTAESPAGAGASAPLFTDALASVRRWQRGRGKKKKKTFEVVGGMAAVSESIIRAAENRDPAPRG